MENVVSLKPKREKQEDLLTLKEAAIKHGYTYAFLYKWCVEGEIPCYDKRGRRAISESDLFKFLDERVKKWRA